MTAGHVSAASTMIGGIALELCGSGGRRVGRRAVIPSLETQRALLTTDCNA
jgi:hypothetical protein